MAITGRGGGGGDVLLLVGCCAKFFMLFTAPDLRQDVEQYAWQIWQRVWKRVGQLIKPCEVVCGICYGNPASLTCTETHHLCGECFDRYAKASFQLGGCYNRRIVHNNSVSEVGSLPCPSFGVNSCSCGAFPERTLREYLSEEGFALWRQADTRRAVEEAEREQRVAREAQENNDAQPRNIVEDIRTAILQVLSVGAAMVCPNCQMRGIKNHGCMHIQCTRCECRWCYCCGRQNRRDANRAYRCPTCETYGIYMESHPGYGSWRIALRDRDEHAGDAALHEFHRRRMAYFVRQIKSVVPANLWREFQEAHPNILEDLPTPGRRIAWDEIDRAEPPLFGRTQEAQLAWRAHAEPYIAILREQLNEHETRQRRDDNQQERHNVDNRQQGRNVQQVQEQDFLAGVVEDILVQQEFGNGARNEDLLNDLLRQVGQ